MGVGKSRRVSSRLALPPKTTSWLHQVWQTKKNTFCTAEMWLKVSLAEGTAAWWIQLVHPSQCFAVAKSEIHKNATPDEVTTEELNFIASSLQASSYTLRAKVSVRAESQTLHNKHFLPQQLLAIFFSYFLWAFTILLLSIPHLPS